jgi:hypothetical protein
MVEKMGVDKFKTVDKIAKLTDLKDIQIFYIIILLITSCIVFFSITE